MTGTITKSEDGKTQSVVISADALNKIFEDKAASINGVPYIVIPVQQTEPKVEVKLPASSLVNAANNQTGIGISIQTDAASFQLPVSALNLNQLAADLGVSLSEMNVLISIEKLESTAAQSVEDAANALGMGILSSIVDFKIMVEANGKAQEITSFGGCMYRELLH